MAFQIIMPALGMNQESGKIISWIKQEGDPVSKGDILLEIETDKTTVEIEAERDGILQNVSAFDGDEVPVATVIGWIVAQGELIPSDLQKPSVQSQASTQPDTTPRKATPVAERMAAEHGIELHLLDRENGRKINKQDILNHLAQKQPHSKLILASPLARRLAQEKELDLSQIAGSGPNGAVLAADVASITPVQPIQESVLPQSRAWMRSAQRLTEAWQTIPHFYLERDIDASQLVAWREVVNQKTAVKTTYTDLLVKCVSLALIEHPRLNASWIDGKIIENNDINIGLAVAIEDGLLVPVIHNADQLRLTDISQQRQQLVERTLAGKSKLSDIQGGTFSISNLGMYQVDRFSAIINPPQVAILAVGNIVERVVPINGVAEIRPFMTLTLSCDHRVVDGARGAQFLETLTQFIQEPLTLI